MSPGAVVRMFGAVLPCGEDRAGVVVGAGGGRVRWGVVVEWLVEVVGE
ncbi:hypothetical protein [Amycolatopsis thermoflava]